MNRSVMIGGDVLGISIMAIAFVVGVITGALFKKGKIVVTKWRIVITGSGILIVFLAGLYLYMSATGIG